MEMRRDTNTPANQESNDMISFKSPQPSPSGVVLSLARALGIVSSVDDVVIVPISQWHAMQERHEADAKALRSALARVVEVGRQCERLTAELGNARAALSDIADSEDEHGKPSTRAWMEQRATEALATARGQK